MWDQIVHFLYYIHMCKLFYISELPNQMGFRGKSLNKERNRKLSDLTEFRVFLLPIHG